MKKQNTIDFADLLLHAETLKYNYNKTHDILDRYYPYHGPVTVYIDDIKDEDNKDAKKILRSFFKKNKVTEFIILPKSC